MIALAGVVTTGNTEKLFGVAPTTFILVRHFLFDGLNTLSNIPNTVMLSKVAPRGNEGPFFAVYGNINDFANIVNGAISAGAIKAFGVTSTNFDNLTSLVVFCSTANVVAAPWTLWTPESDRVRIVGEEPELERELLEVAESPESVADH